MAGSQRGREGATKKMGPMAPPNTNARSRRGGRKGKTRDQLIRSMLQVWERTLVHHRALNEMIRINVELGNRLAVGRLRTELAEFEEVLAPLAEEGRGLRKLRDAYQRREDRSLASFVETIYVEMLKWDSSKKTAGPFSQFLRSRFDSEDLRALARMVRASTDEVMKALDFQAEKDAPVREADGAKDVAIDVAARLINVSSTTVRRRIRVPGAIAILEPGGAASIVLPRRGRAKARRKAASSSTRIKPGNDDTQQ